MGTYLILSCIPKGCGSARPGGFQNARGKCETLSPAASPAASLAGARPEPGPAVEAAGACGSTAGGGGVSPCRPESTREQVPSTWTHLREAHRVTLQLGKALFKRRATKTPLRMPLAIRLLGAGTIVKSLCTANSRSEFKTESSHRLLVTPRRNGSRRNRAA